MGLECNDKCPYKRKQRAETEKQRDHLAMEVETGVMRPQAKGCQGPPELGRQEGSPTASEQAGPADTALASSLESNTRHH